MAEEAVIPPAEETLEDRYLRLATAVSENHDADVLLYSGVIDAQGADQLTELSRDPARMENVFLLLTTRGGSPDAAYRMARCLQRHYKKVVLYIHGMCKSAGTLVASGADELILSDFGEFGPLDVQLGKTDELFENHSGLNITQALTSLNIRVVEFFRESLLDLRAGSGGQLSTKLASEIASRLAIGVYDSIYRQVDPVQLGSMERAVQIASFYAKRLSEERNNLHPNAVDTLVNGYPSHSFVIDIDEARKLFKNVRVPDDTEEQLGACILPVTRDESKRAAIFKLNPPRTPRGDGAHAKRNDEGSAGVSSGSGADHAAHSPTAGPVPAASARNGNQGSRSRARRPAV